MLFGYPLWDASPFEGIEYLRAGQIIVYDLINKEMNLSYAYQPKSRGE